MGQLNLFAHHFSDGIPSELHTFLSGYRDGILLDLAAMRMLDEKPYPLIHINSHKVHRNYIIVPILPPLSKQDISWLFRGIVMGEYPVTRESAYSYAKRRFGSRGQEMRDFRRALEVPRLGLEHYRESYRQGTHLSVEMSDRVLAIEFGEPNVPDDDDPDGSPPEQPILDLDSE